MEVKEGALTKIRQTKRGMQTSRVEHKLLCQEKGWSLFLELNNLDEMDNYLNVITIKENTCIQNHTAS